MLNQNDVNLVMAPPPWGPKDPSLLCHPNIPMPLHGISPRVIYGDGWWDLRRQRAYKDANYKCQACGVPKESAEFHQWLEAHEFYEFSPGLLTFKGIVALCHACHNFIHDGRLNLLYQKRQISKKKFEAIQNHGNSLLAAAGLKTRYANRHRYAGDVSWSGWRMAIDGVLYGPSTKNQESWQRGDWRKWKP